MIKDFKLQMGMFPRLFPSGQSQQGRVWRRTAFQPFLGAAYTGCLCQTTGGGCWGVAGHGPEPHGHTQPAWHAENMRGSLLRCLAPRCVMGRKQFYALCGEKNEWPQTLCVPPLGLSCSSQFRWSHFKLLPVLQTQRFCSLLWLPLLWWCHVFFSHPVSKGPEAWSLTVPSVWDWDLSPFPPVCLDSP